MFVSFTVEAPHPLARGLSGGRFRARKDEAIPEALCRRVAQDARVEVLSVAEEPSGSFRYRLTLRGAVGRQAPVEGAIVVSVRGARLTLSPATESPPPEFGALRRAIEALRLTPRSANTHDRAVDEFVEAGNRATARLRSWDLSESMRGQLLDLIGEAMSVAAGDRRKADAPSPK